MHYAKPYIFLALFLGGVMGCAKAVHTEGGAGKKIDTQTDAANCGKLGNACTLPGDGACREGHCRCSVNQECSWPAECREGICQESAAGGERCWGDGDCAGGHYCIGGHCTPRVCTKEICDGFDNDCDGQTDEAEDTEQACYSGPPETLGVGACHAGKRVCMLGRYTECLDEWVPHREVGRFACDDQDSNCDGCIDGDANGSLGCKQSAPQNVDFCIILDYSGSMAGYIDACKMSLEFFSKFAGNDRFRFSLFTVTDEQSFGNLKVLQPMTDFDTFRNALETMYGGSSGIEPTYDAVYRIAKGDFDNEIGFRPEALPVYIVFGDEPAQTMMNPPITEYDACKAVDDRSVLLSVLTDPLVYPDWDLCAAKFSFSLSTDPTMMMSSLNSILSLPCFNN